MTEKIINEQQIQVISKNIAAIRKNIENASQISGRDPEEIHLMAVTKTVPPEYVNIAVENGINLLGENRAQELLSKYDMYTLKKDNIHFIGHLQRNKVKSIIDKVSMIESVDSVALAQEIDKQAAKIGLVMPILIEVNIGLQESKNGVKPDEIISLLKEISNFKNVSVQGLMTIPPFEDVEKYFKKMQQLYIDIKGQNIDNISMNHLSMGMSSDYESAIKHGANIIRIGSAIFGNRKI